MSRTDRHRPWRVQEDDPYEQRFYWFDQGGKWGWAKNYWFRNCTCTQWYCCMSEPNKAQRRSLRHQDTMRARAAVKGDLEAWDGRLRPHRS